MLWSKRFWAIQSPVWCYGLMQKGSLEVYTLKLRFMSPSHGFLSSHRCTLLPITWNVHPPVQLVYLNKLSEQAETSKFKFSWHSKPFTRYSCWLIDQIWTKDMPSTASQRQLQAVRFCVLLNVCQIATQGRTFLFLLKDPWWSIHVQVVVHWQESSMQRYSLKLKLMSCKSATMVRSHVHTLRKAC